MNRLKRGAYLTLASALLAGVLPGGASSAEPPSRLAGGLSASSHLYTIDAGGSDVRLVSEEVTASGVISVKWLVDGEPVGFTSTEPVDVQVTRRADDKSGSVQVELHGRAEGVERHRSKAEELQMMIDVVTKAGLPQDQIDYWIKHVKEGQAQRPDGPEDQVITSKPRPTLRPPGEIIQARCSTWGNMNAGQKYAQVCSTQKYIATSDGYSWVGDEAVGTARYNDFWVDLEGFTGATTYPTGRQRTHWSPNSTVLIDNSCSDRTFTITYKQVGISASTSVCEDKLVPEPATGKMAARWSGEASDPVGIAYTQVIKKKVGTSNNYDVTLFAYYA